MIWTSWGAACHNIDLTDYACDAYQDYVVSLNHVAYYPLNSVTGSTWPEWDDPDLNMTSTGATLIDNPWGNPTFCGDDDKVLSMASGASSTGVSNKEQLAGVYEGAMTCVLQITGQNSGQRTTLRYDHKVNRTGAGDLEFYLTMDAYLAPSEPTVFAKLNVATILYSENADISYATLGRANGDDSPVHCVVKWVQDVGLATGIYTVSVEVWWDGVKVFDRGPDTNDFSFEPWTQDTTDNTLSFSQYGRWAHFALLEGDVDVAALYSAYLRNME